MDCLSEPAASRGATRVLVVDDEQRELGELCDALRDRGYAPLGCASAREALAALRPRHFDILLTKLSMPGLDGIAMLRAAREKDPLLVGIVLTAHGTVSTVVDAMEAGALGCILPPFKMSEIEPVLMRALAVRQLRVENEQLQMRVRARTEELEAANKELEAFSYSVSHDLRAPLRAVGAFSQMLLRDHADQLPLEARELAERIQTNAARMAELIEDLLVFSRLTRQPLNKRRVNMEELARDAIVEAEKERQGAPVTVKLGELPEGWGDASLLRQVWLNLLSNAFKFTRHNPEPRVEIGCEASGTGQVYSVKDNGVGYNPKYAERLFGVFQRLHRADEFEGTGIGLSIVQRIIQRHGGKVWAEAEEGRGAAFHFSLPRLES